MSIVICKKFSHKQTAESLDLQRTVERCPKVDSLNSSSKYLTIKLEPGHVFVFVWSSTNIYSGPHLFEETLKQILSISMRWSSPSDPGALKSFFFQLRFNSKLENGQINCFLNSVSFSYYSSHSVLPAICWSSILFCLAF